MFFALIMMVGIILAEVPQMINYQGYLIDNENNAITGTQSVQFLIYGQAGGGEPLWNEIQAVTLSNGNFSVLLGSVTSIPIAVFNSENTYLAVKVGSDPEMVPRKQITSVGYAYRAINTDSLAGKSVGDFVQKGEENSVTDEMIETQYFSDINTINTDDGSISIIPGDHIQVLNNLSEKTITISAVADEIGDNMGDHTATENIQTKGHWISNDGNDEGIFVLEDGRVGIGTDNPNEGLFKNTQLGAKTNLAESAITGYANNSSVSNSNGGVFLSDGTNESAGVIGITNNEGSYRNYGGYFIAHGNTGQGVRSTSYGDNGIGVYGLAIQNSSGINYGGYFTSYAANGYGLYSNGKMYGGYFKSTNNSGYGAYCSSEGSGSVGCYGIANGSGDYANTGGFFIANGDLGKGVYAIANGDNGVAVYGYSSNWAGYFAGNVNVSGTLSKAAGSFKIDHPQDPENKYLQHSFVESPDMMNVYNGNVILDINGEAIVEMPKYFEALNIEFRYQLTCIGGFAPVYIAEKINNNQFKISGGEVGMEISWLVTGVRNDEYAKNNRIEVEVPKDENENGKYIHPNLYNMPESMGIGYEEQQKMVNEENYNIDQ